jgi:hypothetical protein
MVDLDEDVAVRIAVDVHDSEHHSAEAAKIT